jgi:hypothetical protein
MSHFKRTNQMIDKIIADITNSPMNQAMDIILGNQKNPPNLNHVCEVCGERYDRNELVDTGKGFYRGTSVLCQFCVEIRNEMIALGLESSREIEADDDRYSN